LEVKYWYLALAIIGVIGVLSVISYEIRNWWSDSDDEKNKDQTK
jgi:hypothetical protein